MADGIPFEEVPANQHIEPFGKRRGKQSWKEQARHIGNMTIGELKEKYTHAISSLPDVPTATLRELALVHAYIATINNPNSSMLTFLSEREDGRVPNTVVSTNMDVSDWKEYVRDLQEQGMDISEADVIAEAKLIVQEQTKHIESGETNDLQPLP